MLFIPPYRSQSAPRVTRSAAQKFEKKFVAQGAYDNRTIFDSLDLAWSLLRIFPRELLRRVTIKTLDEW